MWKPSIQPFASVVIGTMVLLAVGSTQAQVCAANLTNTAHVLLSTPGNNYDVYFDTNSASADFYPERNGHWVRDSLFRSHHVFVGTNGFRNPNFSANPNDTCIHLAAPCWANAPLDRINLDGPCIRSSSEPWTRSVMNHELFHHVQYAYINFNDWQTWGGWTIEGTPPAMEDRSFLDLDTNAPNSRYVGDVRGFLGDPNFTLMSRNYSAALFWNYMAEQFGTIKTEPNYGADVILDFWQRTRGNRPDSIRYLRETIAGRAPGRTLEDVYLDFSIANLLHDKDLASMTMTERGRYSYVDTTPAGGGTPYRSVATTTVPNINVSVTNDVVRWGTRYFLADVDSQECGIVGAVAQSMGNQNLGWALVGFRDGNKVEELARGIGQQFYASFFDDPTAPYRRLGLVVVGLNDSAEFRFRFGNGQAAGSIRLPTSSAIAYVGKPEAPRRFQARLRILGPAALTPPGAAGNSVRGLLQQSFTARLRSTATGALYPATILNSSYVGGEYWLAIAAPEITDPADGERFDLQICTCRTASGCTVWITAGDSVVYGEVQRNQMLVMDRSWSMHYPQPAEVSKIEAAKNAARLFAHSAADQDRLGLVTFTGNNSECDIDAKLERPLLTMMNGGTDNRAPLITAINDVVEDGWTSIGDGLAMGVQAMLSASPALGARDQNTLLLMSDGKENEGNFWASVNTICASLPVNTTFETGGAAEGMKIDTFAFSANSDAALLQRIATATRGTFYAVSVDPPVLLPAADGAGGASLGGAPILSQLEVPNRLAHVYRSSQEEIHGHDRLHFRADQIPPGVSRYTIPVTESKGGGVTEATFSFNWNLDTVNVEITLEDAMGNEVINGAPGWTVLRDGSHKVYHYDGVLPRGDYRVTADAGDAVQLMSMLSGIVVHGVDFDLYLSQPRAAVPDIECQLVDAYDYLRGLPVDVLANVTGIDGGVTGLEVIAVVENADGSVNRLSLYDDGLRDNGVEGDGVYGNRYTRTPFFSRGGEPDFPGNLGGVWGNYTVNVSVRGDAPSGERFERSGTRFFHVYEFEDLQEYAPCDPDLDGDELPDRWEDLYGLDKYDPSDAFSDLDFDGLTALDEFYYGTLPLNPDTDQGGESDGSEVFSGRDPLYDKDDELPEILDYGIVDRVYHVPVNHPQPNTLTLRFPVNSAYRFMEIWVFDWGLFDWVIRDVVDLTVDDSGLYRDQNLVNDTAYFYYLVAEGHGGGRTPPTEVFVGTPKADPIPPVGGILINWGAPFTSELEVVVESHASDDTVEIMLSQDSAFEGAFYQEFEPGLLFELESSGAAEVVTIYARFRDQAGNESDVSHASILLDVDGDEDKDGLLDRWEIANFNTLEFSAEDNPDDDTEDNGEEFKNGWDPNDPASPRQFVGVMIQREENRVIVHFEGELWASETVEGPYEPLPGLESPYVMELDSPMRFFQSK